MGMVLRVLLMVSLVGAILFGSAGHFALPMFWGLLIVFAAYFVIVLLTIDRGLLQERMRPGPGGKDRLMRWIAMPFILAQLVVAGLDVGRFGWSNTVPFGVQVAGLAGYAVSLALAYWAMAVNRFFSSVVRIQQDRGHHLITAGPYQYVRHPGYAGGMVACLCSGLALGSWWSMLPVAGMVLLFLRRTVMEDRFLKKELPGYAEYAQQVRFRLVPG